MRLRRLAFVGLSAPAWAALGWLTAGPAAGVAVWLLTFVGAYAVLLVRRRP